MSFMCGGCVSEIDSIINTKSGNKSLKPNFLVLIYIWHIQCPGLVRYSQIRRRIHRVSASPSTLPMPRNCSGSNSAQHNIWSWWDSSGWAISRDLMKLNAGKWNIRGSSVTSSSFRLHHIEMVLPLEILWIASLSWCEQMLARSKRSPICRQNCWLCVKLAMSSVTLYHFWLMVLWKKPMFINSSG